MQPEMQAVEGDAPPTLRATSAAVTAGPRISPAAVVAGSVVLGAIVYVVLGRSISAPHRFSDELMYWDAAGSLADGSGLRVRGGAFPFGPLYPLLLAPILWAVPHRDVAYDLAKALNGVLFASVAVPAYLLARQVLRAWSSVGVAALSVAVPWAMYVSVITTESLAYPIALWGFYAIFRVLERPTPLRQVVALLVIAVAFAARSQLAILCIVYALSLAAVVLLPRGRRLRDLAATAWPSGAALGVALSMIVVPRVLRGGSVLDWTSGYSALLRSYRPGPVLTWLVYQLANLELAVAVVPFVVTPVVLGLFLRRARAGSARHGAFLALFCASVATFLLVAAAFNSTPWGSFALHDRVVFYLVPLWLIVLFAWLEDGMPRPRRELTVGCIGALLLPFALVANFRDYARDDALEQFNGVATTLWADLRAALAPTPVPAEVVLLLFAFGLVATTVLLPRPRAKLVPAIVLLVFAMTAELSWVNARNVADAWGASLPRSEWRWVDERVHRSETVTLLVVPGACARYRVINDAFYLTEFFNTAVGRAAYVGPTVDRLPAAVLHERADGALVRRSGAPLGMGLVVAETGLDLAGRRIGFGARGRLTLWRVNGALRLRAPLNRRELARAACLRKS